MLLDIIINAGETYYSSTPKGFDLQSLFQFLGGAVIAIAGFAIAFRQFRLARRAYENRDVKKTFTIKQLETVFELNKLIRKTNLEIRLKASEDQPYWTQMFFRLSQISISLRKQFPLDERLLECKQFMVSRKVLYELEFYQFAENDFLPAEIVNELEKFGNKMLNQRDPPIVLSKDRVYLVEVDDKGDSLADFQLVADNPVFQSLENFLIQVLNVKRAIHSWLEKYDVAPNDNDTKKNETSFTDWKKQPLLFKKRK